MSGTADIDWDPTRSRPYRWRPFVAFEDTNLVGNVYFARFISWQGRCREAFLAEHTPDLLAALARELRLVTLSVSCEFFEELHAFDDVELEMRLAARRGHRLALSFDYRLARDGASQLVARGAQEVACMRVAAAGHLEPAAIPDNLALALQAFSAPGA